MKGMRRKGFPSLIHIIDIDDVVYVSFECIAIISIDHLKEFSWGLTNSEYNFIWVICPDLIKGESSILPTMLIDETKERGMMVKQVVCMSFRSITFMTIDHLKEIA
ncbi:hypothetical protein IEQ34_015999 [Dendrobium chrysotoxum]|uniref:Uncharacterized protein n=1 Tax=Dendrobium chrysotoxum TaxID=161865 RepID=A0AAV7GIC1_DENCH|nr:hypothetical protein IEQ34_015999 [Dendrobium chrysotoxum]